MRILGVFLKYWQPGDVKTRLARRLGPARACDVYLAMVRHLLARFQQSADSRCLVTTPAGYESEVAAEAGEGWRVENQGPGDLGIRLQRFCQRLFSEDPSAVAGNRRLVVVGGDCPQLTTEIVDRAFACLQRVPVVLGPSSDGGYYLVGVRGNYPALFQEIDWGTERVLSQTLARAAAAGLECESLEPLHDVDEWDDLERVRRILGRSDDRLDRILREAIDHIVGEA